MHGGNQCNRETNADENQTVENEVKKYFKELSEVQQIEKCRTCVCFCEIVSDLSEALETVSGSTLESIRREVAGWMAECGKTELHDCLGCDPCFPVKPFNDFHETQN